MILRGTIFILVLFTVLSSRGQSIRATVDKQRILLGEPFQLTVEAVYPSRLRLSLGSDSLPHFEKLEGPKVDSTVENDNITIKKIFRLRSFDSGHWVIPSFVISGKIRSDTIPIDVVFSDFDSTQPYHPITDIIEVKPDKQGNWWIYAIAGGVLLIALLVFLLRKRKPGRAKENRGTDEDAYRVAMDQLKKLRTDKPETRIYYTALTSIFRNYLFKRKGILSLQKTTDDLLVQMRSLPLGREDAAKLAISLRFSDMVKFAKYQPSPEEDMEVMEVIRSTIEKLETAAPN